MVRDAPKLPYRQSPASIAGDTLFLGQAKNMLTYVFQSNCSRPLWIYAVTLLPSLVESSALLLFPGPDDYVRSYGKQVSGGGTPKGKRGVKHSRRKKTRTLAKPTNRWSQAGLRHLLAWTQPLEYVGLGMLLYGVATQTEWTWQSMVERVDPCGTDHGTFQRTATNQSWNMLAGGGAANMPKLEENTAGWTNTAFSVNLPPGTYVAVLAATLRPTFPATYQAGVRLKGPGLTGGIRFHQSGRHLLEPSKPLDLIAAATFSTISGGNLAWETYGSTVPVGVTAITARIVVARRALIGS